MVIPIYILLVIRLLEIPEIFSKLSFLIVSKLALKSASTVIKKADS